MRAPTTTKTKTIILNPKTRAWRVSVSAQCPRGYVRYTLEQLRELKATAAPKSAEQKLYRDMCSMLTLPEPTEADREFQRQLDAEIRKMKL